MPSFSVPSSTRGLCTGTRVCHDTTISRDASAPNWRCRPVTGGMPRVPGCTQSVGDMPVVAAAAGATVPRNGSAPATVSPAPTAPSHPRRLRATLPASASSPGAVGSGFSSCGFVKLVTWEMVAACGHRRQQSAGNLAPTGGLHKTTSRGRRTTIACATTSRRGSRRVDI